MVLRTLNGSALALELGRLAAEGLSEELLAQTVWEELSGGDDL